MRNEVGMYFKDFFWFIFKENFLVNLIYIYLFPFVYKFIRKPIIKSNCILTKDMLISQARRKPLLSIVGHTSGTTNTPIVLYRSFFSILHEEYIYKSYLNKCDVPLNPRIAVLRGDNVKKGSDNSPPFWLKMPFTKRLVFSSFHLSPNNATLYLDKLTSEKPDIILAYPSSITFLARHALSIGWKPSWMFFGVFTSSETFSVEDQNICSEVFGKVFDHYGQAERVAVLQQCDFRNYHVRDDYSKVEFHSDANGIKILGSNYYNKSMPLVNYDTGDYVLGLNEQYCCACGNESRFVKSILGRNDDYIVLKDGRHIGRMDVVFKSIVGLVQCQIVQLNYDLIQVRYTPAVPDNCEKLVSEMHTALKDRLGDDVQFQFVLAEKIERAKSGKFKSVVREFLYEKCDLE